MSLYEDITLRVEVRIDLANKRSDEIEANIARMKVLQDQVSRSGWWQFSRRAHLQEESRRLYARNTELFRLNLATIQLNSIDLNTLSRLSRHG